MPQTPTVGRIVLYTISPADESFLASKFASQIGRTLNKPCAGDVYPALIVRVFSELGVNLKVQLDGEPVFWATSRVPGEGEGRWALPTIAPAAAPVAADPDKG
jgi:hypothetical protein